MNDVPLIWTTQGNLPVDSLQYEAKWEVTPEYVKLVETYRKDGELVRENAHVLALKGLKSDSISQPFA